MTDSGLIPRVPDGEDDRHRRAHDILAEIFNDLIRLLEVVRGSDGQWTISPGAGSVVGYEVFGQRSFLPLLPVPDAQPILAARVFAQRVFYGSIG